MKTTAFRLILILCLGLSSSLIWAQTVSQTQGNITGEVKDSIGAIVPNASVKISGISPGTSPERTVNTNEAGLYLVENLNPGLYSVRVSMTNFKTAEAQNVTVLVGKTVTVNIALEAGNIAETVTVTAGAELNQASTEVSSNLNDVIYSTVPVQRGLSSLFYLAPGVTNGLGGGQDNPSISGGSALDNLYVADGVNITDTAFGGIGTFSRTYGPLGTGINTSFIKEVQVKTAGFEPQYGQSQGGIVNIVTQSGGNEFHGAFYGYATPKAFESTRLQPDEPDRVNKVGKLLHREFYDFGADVGGPIAKDKLFFFGSFNPSIKRALVRGAERNAAEIQANTGTDSGLRLLRGPEFANRTRTLNYAGKVEWAISPEHQLAFSIFGDPSRTNKSSWAGLVIDNTSADSALKFGTRNISLRYNGSLTPTTTINASFGMGRSEFDETGFSEVNQITDRRGSDAANIAAFTGGLGPDRGNFVAQGLGFFEPTLSRSRRLDVNLAKTHTLWGQHTLGIGYTFQRGYYDGTRDRSGPKWTIPAGNGLASGQTTNIALRLRFRPDNGGGLLPTLPVRLTNGTISQVPVRLQVFRAEFGDNDFTTYSNYNAGYVQDTWRINRFVTALLGLRSEQERLIGSPGPSGNRIGYSFTGQWAPRLGVTVDPLGRGKTKAFYNYGRFFEYIPLDLAERSLSVEQDWLGALFIPEFTVDSGGVRRAVVNQFGTVNPLIDAAHQLTSSAASIADPQNPITPGTKLGFTDEHTIGFEQQLPKNFVLSVRYIDRRSKRIVEDAASVSPEAAEAGIVQVYYIGNISSQLDAAVNLVPFTYTTGGAVPSGCARTAGGAVKYNFDGPGNQSVCFAQTGIDPATDAEINTPDGIADGFVDPVRNYRAVEIELNRRFANGWQGFFNWRIASLKGNFEGHLRNDNGQTDPAISSLFDFTGGDLDLLGDQFAVGTLNTDRRHILNVFGSYAFSERSVRSLNGLTLGLNMHVESGLPINRFGAHPVYQNAGEIPRGGRGSLGRTPWFTQFDVHSDYAIRLTENTRVKFVADFFNIFNRRTVLIPTQFEELDLGGKNVDFLKPAAFHNPFNMRLGIRFEF